VETNDNKVFIGKLFQVARELEEMEIEELMKKHDDWFDYISALFSEN